MKGIDQWQNENGWYVFQIHYSADPAKDPNTEEGKEWYARARKGMEEPDWRKEYEIDWFALKGKLVYTEFDRNIHVVKPFDIPKEWNRYMAIDPGMRVHTACLWCAVSPDNDVYFYREHYVKEKIVSWHAEMIKKYEKEDGINSEKIIRLIDHSSHIRNMVNNGSIYSDYRDNGIYAINANKDIEAGINKVKEGLKVDEEIGKPRFFFFENLVFTINELVNYRWKELSDVVALTKNPEDKPIGKDDHLLDCLRYIAMADPHYCNNLDNKKDECYYEDDDDDCSPKEYYSLGKYTTG